MSELEESEESSTSFVESREVDAKWSTERLLAIITVFSIIFLPTIGLNYSSGKFHPLTENSFMWPWLILVYVRPEEHFFQTEMYHFILPPYTLLIFFPFLIGLKLAYDQFKMEEDREITAGYLAFISLAQILMIWLVFGSQEPSVTEDIRMFYLPQLLILILQAGFGGIWYYQKLQDVLTTPAAPVDAVEEDESEA